MPQLLKPTCLEPVLCNKRSHCQQWRNRHREQTHGHGDGEEGEGEMYGESNVETYITVYKIDSQQEFAVHLRKLKEGLCINLEGLDG